MKSSSRYALIGTFVVGAILIASIGAAVFFGVGLGKGKVRAVMVFRGNVNGLEVGTPVQFRGMKIGEVKRVRTIYDPDTKQILFPVYAEFTGTIEVPGYDAKKSSSGVRRAWIDEMIDHGLRAQLQTKSFVTGQQMIMLDFVADKPAVYSKIETELLEIPTVRSPNEAIVDAIRELPVQEMILDGQKLLSNANALLSDTSGKPGSLPKLITDLGNLTQQLGTTVPPLTTELTATARDLRSTLTEARGAFASISKATGALGNQASRGGDNLEASAREFQQLARGLQGTVTRLDQVMGRVETSLGRVDLTMARVEHTLSEDAPLGSGLSSTLSEVSAAAQSLRYAVDGLYRKPESLIFGRKSANR